MIQDWTDQFPKYFNMVFTILLTTINDKILKIFDFVKKFTNYLKTFSKQCCNSGQFQNEGEKSQSGAVQKTFSNINKSN